MPPFPRLDHAVRRPIAATAVALVMALLLTGCAGDPHPVPLTRSQQIALYERFSRQDWDQIAQLSPSTPRPDLRVRTVSTGNQWALDMAACLREQGITQFSVTADGSIDLSQSPGFTSGLVGLPQIICTAQHPNTRYLAVFLSDSQLSVLYDYYVNFLRPCLTMHTGAPLARVPSRRAFIARYYANPWSPYDDSRLTTSQTDIDGRDRIAALLAVCPPQPVWLRR